MLIYGNVPRELKGSYNYANSALVSETIEATESTTPSYFETAKHVGDINHVHCSIVATGAYEVEVQVSNDHGDTWQLQYSRTEDSESNFAIQYTSPTMMLRMYVVSSDNPVLCVLRQG